MPAGADLRIDEDLTLTLPLGEITLPKAQLDVEMGDDNRIARLHGLVEAPFPTLGVLSDVRMVQPALAEMGLDTGANLSHLAAPLDPERQYLFFNITSGMDVAGKVAATGDTLSLSAPAGQALTLVIDTEEPLVYLAGNVTVNTSGELLLAGPLQELAQQSALIPDGLPLRQRTQVTVSGLAGKNAEEHLKLGGAWSVGAGALGRWLGVEATPLAVEGLLTLSAEGLLLDGVVRSSIAPDTVLDSSVQLTAFIPFTGRRATTRSSRPRRRWLFRWPRWRWMAAPGWSSLLQATWPTRSLPRQRTRCPRSTATRSDCAARTCWTAVSQQADNGADRRCKDLAGSQRRLAGRAAQA